MTTLAFIPVRGGSKSIPLKNIQLFCGKPLVYWNIKALSESFLVDKIIVATDSDEIESVVNRFNFIKVEVYRRNAENATDTASTESVMIEYLSNRNLEDNVNFMLVQATSPLTQTDDFDRALKQLEESGADSLLSCVRCKRFFWTINGESINYNYKYRPRRQDFEGEMMENGAFYINKVGNILRDHNRLSGKISIFEMDEFTAVEIDEPLDWMMAENLMRKYILNKGTKLSIKLFLSDVDGVLTDGGMYYAESGVEMKKFNTKDGMAFQRLREKGIKTGLITSEQTKLVINRAAKIKADYLYQGKKHNNKLEAAREICQQEGISLTEVAYIGDDINCYELLSSVGIAACPSDAIDIVKEIPNINILRTKGGEGVVREFVERFILNSNN